jgi:nitrogen fixation NifU-like protein
MAFHDLYQEIILEHYRNPRNAGSLEHIEEAIAHENPACGDTLKLHLQIDQEQRVEDILFDGQGCAISMASASIMTELVKGKPVFEVKKLIDSFSAVMRGEAEPDLLDEYGDLASLKGVIQYPVRVKCATLAWHALELTLDGG